MKLNWNGRAPQAAQIPDAEWENHKAVICLLRPLMTLEALMVIMARDYNFTPSYVVCFVCFKFLTPKDDLPCRLLQH